MWSLRLAWDKGTFSNVCGNFFCNYRIIDHLKRFIFMQFPVGCILIYDWGCCNRNPHDKVEIWRAHLSSLVNTSLSGSYSFSVFIMESNPNRALQSWPWIAFGWDKLTFNQNIHISWKPFCFNVGRLLYGRQLSFWHQLCWVALYWTHSCNFQI